MYIPVAQRKTGYTPINERVDYTGTLGDLSRLGSPSFATKTSTQAIPDETTPSTLGFLKGVGQATARGYQAAGSFIASRATGGRIPSTFTPQGKLQEALFGTKEPISLQSVGEEYPFVPKGSKIAPFIAGAGTLLDLTGAGGAKGLKGLTTALKTADKIEDVSSIMKKAGFVDDIISQYAPTFAKTADTVEIEKGLLAAEKLQNTTIAGRVSTDIQGRAVEQQFARKATALEMKSPTAKSRGYNTIPDKVGYEKVFKPYGDEGTGYYYTKLVEAPVSPQKPTTAPITTKVENIPLTKQLPTPEGLPKIKTRAPRVLPPELENLRQAISAGEDALSDMPGKGLVKYVSRETGELPGLGETSLLSKTEKRAREFAKSGDALFQDIIGQELSKSGDVTVAQEMIDQYRRAKQRLKELKTAYKQTARTIREEKILANASEKAAKLQEALIEFEKKYPQLVKATLPLSEEATKGAKVGYKVGVQVGKAETRNTILTKLRNTMQATDEIRTSIVDFVKKNLDTKDRGKALVLVRDAKTQRDITKAFARINRWAEDAEKTTTKGEILKLQKQIMDSPSIAIDYKARVKELMGDFELKGHREDTLARLKKTQEFLQAEAAKGNDVEMPRRILRSLELLNRTPFDEITTSQLTGLKAEMELLAELGKTKFRTIESIWEMQKGKILDEVANQGAKPIQNIELIKPEIGERLTLTQKFKNLVWSAGNQAARIDKAISPMDTIFDLLDGGKGTYAGANFRFFKGQVDSGYGRYISRTRALQEPIIELATKYKLDDTNFERMGIVAAREQDGGLQKLTASGFTEEQVNAVKLSVQEQEVLDKMRETFDSQFPEIQDVMRRVYNKSVEKVKNYFSFMTDWKAMDDSEVFERFGSQAPEQYGAPRKNVEAGFTKSRVGGGQVIKVNAMDVFMQHTDNTSYLLELGEASKMLGEVASSPKYAELVGDVGQLMVREWVDVIARKGGAAGVAQIAGLDTLRRNVGAGILGLKLSTIAIQPTALIDGMGFIGTKYGMKGITNFATSKEWREFILNMPEIKDRLGGEFALRELVDDNWLQNLQRKGFVPMQTLDQLTAGAIATGAYERKMIELGEVIDFAKPNKEALEYAQLAVRRTQSSGAFKDVPLAVSRGALTGNRSLDRAMLQFQNFLLTRWSRIRHDAIRAGVNTKDPKKAIPVFTAILFAALAASGIRLGVNKIQDFITGREDEDTIEQDLQKGFMYEMTGNVPFLGTAVSMALYDGEMFPILDAPKGVISGLNRAITSKSEGAKLRGLTEFAGSTGALLGIPGSTQAEQLVRGSLQEEKKPTKSKLKTPPGLPELPSIKKTLPTLPGLPKLP